MASDFLFQLTRSMTPAEKRYFKRNAREASYIELFDILSDMSEPYDEEAVKAQLSKPGYAANLSVGKNYLYHQLLDSLRTFHIHSDSKPQPQMIAANYWADLQVLLGKNLIKQAFKLIGQAKRHCRIYHLDLDLLKFLQAERNLISRFEKKGAMKKLNALITACEELQEHLSMEAQLVALYERFFLTSRSENMEKVHAAFADFQAFLRRNQVYFAKKASFNCKTFYHFTLAYGLEKQGKFKLAYRQYAELLALYDQDKRVLAANLDRYLRIFNNYFNSLLQAGDFKDERKFLQTISRLKEAQTDDPTLRDYIDQQYLNFQLLYYLRSLQYEKAVYLDEPVAEMLMRQKDRLIVDRKVTFYFHMGLAHFMRALEAPDEKQARLDAALGWFNRLEEEEKFDTKALVRNSISAFLILTYIEMDAHDLAWYRIRTYMSALRDAGQTKSMFFVLCSGLRRILNAGDPGKKRALLAALNQKMKAFSDIEEILAWIQSQIQRA
jgi:hypothetical protein